MALVFEELTYRIRGLCIETQNSVGVGLNEQPYHRHLVDLLHRDQLRFASKPTIWLTHRGKQIMPYQPDLLVDDCVVLELKSARNGLCPAHSVQLFTYLKLCKYRVGILVNFGMRRVQFRRIVFDEKPATISWSGDTVCQQQCRSQLYEEVLSGVLQQHGIGYSDIIYHRLIEAECSWRRQKVEMPLVRQIQVASFRPTRVELPGLLINDNAYVLPVSYCDDYLDFETERCRTAARYLGLSHGLLAHFGSKGLSLHAVSV